MTEVKVSTRRRHGQSADVVQLRGRLIELPELSQHWQEFGNCLGADPDIFYPERGESLEPAKAVCRECVVQNDCLEYALNNHEKYGIWGGKNIKERKMILFTRGVIKSVKYRQESA